MRKTNWGCTEIANRIHSSLSLSSVFKNSYGQFGFSKSGSKFEALRGNPFTFSALSGNLTDEGFFAVRQQCYPSKYHYA